MREFKDKILAEEGGRGETSKPKVRIPSRDLGLNLTGAGQARHDAQQKQSYRDVHQEEGG